MSRMDVDEERQGRRPSSLAGPSAAASETAEKEETNAGFPLHRVRFVDWQPSAVSALAFLPLPRHVEKTSSSVRSLLAVGRDNGNIDLCIWVEDDAIPIPPSSVSSPQDARESSAPAIVSKGWVVDTTLVGSSPAKVDALIFLLSPTQPYATPRLFSSSGGAIVTEHFLPPHLLSVGHEKRFAQPIPASMRKSASSVTSTSRSISSQGGSVWSLAASPLGKSLAIGCEDGTVRIIDIEDGRFELLTHSRSARRGGDGVIRGVSSTLDRAKTRIVSLAWGPPKRREKDSSKGKAEDDSEEDEEDGWEDSFIVGGTTQSSALVWSTTTGRITNKLLVDRHRREQTIVWSVATLADGTCVLGDSLGHVSFFDAKTLTLLHGGKFASHGKNADVLALCVGPDGKSLYSASVDQKVVEYALVSGRAEQRMNWVMTGRRRLHAHDIRAIGIDPPYDPIAASSARPVNRLPLLVSGGVDFHLVITPASSPSKLTVLQPSKAQGREKGVQRAKLQSRKITAHDHVNPISSTAVTTFADTIHRRVPFVPASGRGSALGGGSVVRICKQRRWIITRREKSIAIWKLPANATATEDDWNAADGWSKVLEIQAKVQSNVVCVEVSNDGRFLLVSDVFETKLFELLGDDDDIVPKRVRSFTSAFAGQGLERCPGSSAATFTPDSGRVVVATQPGSFLHLLELPKWTSRTSPAKGACSLLKSFGEHRQAASGRAVAGKVARMSLAASTSNGHAAQQNGVKANGRPKTNGRRAHSTPSSASEESDMNSDAEANEVDSGTPSERTTFARIDAVDVSPDGQYLVSIDTAKRIQTYSLDTLHHRGAMPSPAQRPNAVAFDPWQPTRMMCVLPTNQVVLYDVEKRQQLGSAAEFGGAEEEGFLHSLNERLALVRDTAVGAFWLAPSVVVVWGATFMCTSRFIRRERFAVEEPVNGSGASTSRRKGKRAYADAAIVNANGGGGKAVESNEDGREQSVRKWTYWRSWLMTKYQPLLHVGIVPNVDGDEKKREIVVVERPYYDVAQSLPPTWFSGAGYGA